MILIFGRKRCSGCQDKLAELKKEEKIEGKDYKYYDIDNDPEGLSILCSYGKFGDGMVLPIIIDTDIETQII